MAAQLNGPSTNGIASLAEQREATIAALRNELLGYERSGKTARAAAVIDELAKLGVDVKAEERASKAKKRAEAEKPAEVEQATV